MASITGHFISTDFSPLARDDNSARYRARLDEDLSKKPQAKVIDIRPQHVDLEKNRAAADPAAIPINLSSEEMEARNSEPFTYTADRGQILLKSPPLRRGVIVDTKI